MTKPVQIQPVAWIKQGGLPAMTTDPLIKMAWECDGANVVPLIPEAALLQVREDIKALSNKHRAEWILHGVARHKEFSDELLSLAATLGNQEK